MKITHVSSFQINTLLLDNDVVTDGEKSPDVSNNIFLLDMWPVNLLIKVRIANVQ